MHLTARVVSCEAERCLGGEVMAELRDNLQHWESKIEEELKETQ